MAGISVGGGHGKRDPNSEIPLVPFIDLLLCCVMFLLVTAVWNQLARLDANQRQPGAGSDMLEQANIKLILQVQADGFVLASTAGDRIEIPKQQNAYDMETLREKLRVRRAAEPNRKDLVVAPEDGVHYADVVASMDMVTGEGFSEMTLSDGSTL